MCQVWNSNMWVHRHYLQNNKGNILRENCLNLTIFGAANLTSWWFCHVFLTLCVLVQPWRCTYLWLLPVWEQQHRILNICLKINVSLLAPMNSSKQIALQSTLFALVKKCIPHPSLMVAFFFFWLLPLLGILTTDHLPLSHSIPSILCCHTHSNVKKHNFSFSFSLWNWIQTENLQLIYLLGYTCYL